MIAGFQYALSLPYDTQGNRAQTALERERERERASKKDCPSSSVGPPWLFFALRSHGAIVPEQLILLQQDHGGLGRANLLV